MGIGILVAIAALASISVAAGQYPPAGSPVTITASDPNPGTGETISLTIHVTEQTSANIDTDSGRAILASVPKDEANTGQVTAASFAAPYNCTSSVSGGAGATVTPASFTTDASGDASLSLYTGTQAASLTVSVNCGGALSGQAVIPVGAAAPTATTAPGQPTATTAPGQTAPTSAPPAPPSTGEGVTTSGGDSFPWLPIVAVAAIAAAAAGFLVLRTKSGETNAR
jgi:hypothetical protein